MSKKKFWKENEKKEKKEKNEKQQDLHLNATTQNKQLKLNKQFCYVVLYVNQVKKKTQ